MSAHPCPAEPCAELGDLILVLLAGTLQGLSYQLQSDGHDGAAELVADLVVVVDDYLDRAQACTIGGLAPDPQL